MNWRKILILILSYGEIGILFYFKAFLILRLLMNKEIKNGTKQSASTPPITPISPVALSVGVVYETV